MHNARPSCHFAMLSLLLASENWRLDLAAMILLPFLILPPSLCNSLQLDLLETSNTSSIASGQSSSLNALRLTTHNDCFDHSLGHSFTTTKSDCERALDKMVMGKSLIEPRSFSYRRGVTDRLPLDAEYASCSIGLMMSNLQDRITMTYAEIYAELLGPDGLLKECLGSSVSAADALGGQTAFGPQNKLIVDVAGRPWRAAEQRSR